MYVIIINETFAIYKRSKKRKTGTVHHQLQQKSETILTVKVVTFNNH